MHSAATICIVTETYAPEVNGVANTLGYWVRGLKDRRHRLQIVRPRQRGEQSIIRGDGETHITTIGLPIPGYAELKFGLPAKRRLVRFWKDEAPDAIYIATEGPLGHSAIQAAKRFGIPVYSGFHTNFQAYSRFYGLGWLEKLILAYLRKFHNTTLRTIVPTTKQQGWLETKGFSHVSVLRRGIDAQRFHPDKRDDALRASWGVKKPEHLVCLYVGRIAGEKNVRLFAQASTLAKYSPQPVTFVCVGDGPQRKSLEAEFPDIIFAGMQHGEALAAHYASADIFLFPSQTDTFGNVVLEALASGLALVAFNDAAAREVLHHGHDAMLAPLEDEPCFLQHVQTLIASPASRHSMRQHARDTAMAMHWDQIIDQFEAMLLGKTCQEGVNHGLQQDTFAR